MGTLSSMSRTNACDVSLDLWPSHTYVPEGDDIPSFFFKLASALRLLPSVTSLSISDTGDGQSNRLEWSLALQAVPRLQELIVNRVSCGPGEFGLFEALGGDMDHLLCTNLRSLTIYGMQAEDLDMDRIIACLGWRRLYAPLEKLSLRYTTGMTENMLENLRSVIAAVEWEEALIITQGPQRLGRAVRVHA
jgi:hypothetical protein